MADPVELAITIAIPAGGTGRRLPSIEAIADFGPIGRRSESATSFRRTYA